jgi:hypothetical protein
MNKSKRNLDISIENIESIENLNLKSTKNDKKFNSKCYYPSEIYTSVKTIKPKWIKNHNAKKALFGWWIDEEEKERIGGEMEEKKYEEDKKKWNLDDSIDSIYKNEENNTNFLIDDSSFDNDSEIYDRNSLLNENDCISLLSNISLNTVSSSEDSLMYNYSKINSIEKDYYNEEDDNNNIDNMISEMMSELNKNIPKTIEDSVNSAVKSVKQRRKLRRKNENKNIISSIKYSPSISFSRRRRNISQNNGSIPCLNTTPINIERKDRKKINKNSLDYEINSLSFESTFGSSSTTINSTISKSNLKNDSDMLLELDLSKQNDEENTCPCCPSEEFNEGDNNIKCNYLEIEPIKSVIIFKMATLLNETNIKRKYIEEVLNKKSNEKVEKVKEAGFKIKFAKEFESNLTSTTNSITNNSTAFILSNQSEELMDDEIRNESDDDKYIEKVKILSNKSLPEKELSFRIHDSNSDSKRLKYKFTQEYKNTGSINLDINNDSYNLSIIKALNQECVTKNNKCIKNNEEFSDSNFIQNQIETEEKEIIFEETYLENVYKSNKNAINHVIENKYFFDPFSDKNGIDIDYETKNMECKNDFKIEATYKKQDVVEINGDYNKDSIYITIVDTTGCDGDSSIAKVQSKAQLIIASRIRGCQARVRVKGIKEEILSNMNNNIEGQEVVEIIPLSINIVDTTGGDGDSSIAKVQSTAQLIIASRIRGCQARVRVKGIKEEILSNMNNIIEGQEVVEMNPLSINIVDTTCGDGDSPITKVQSQSQLILASRIRGCQARVRVKGIKEETLSNMNNIIEGQEVVEINPLSINIVDTTCSDDRVYVKSIKEEILSNMNNNNIEGQEVVEMNPLSINIVDTTCSDDRVYVKSIKEEILSNMNNNNIEGQEVVEINPLSINIVDATCSDDRVYVKSIKEEILSNMNNSNIEGQEVVEINPLSINIVDTTCGDGDSPITKVQSQFQLILASRIRGCQARVRVKGIKEETLSNMNNNNIEGQEVVEMKPLYINIVDTTGCDGDSSIAKVQSQSQLISKIGFNSYVSELNLAEIQGRLDLSVRKGHSSPLARPFAKKVPVLPYKHTNSHEEVNQLMNKPHIAPYQSPSNVQMQSNFSSKQHQQVQQQQHLINNSSLYKSDIEDIADSELINTNSFKEIIKKSTPIIKKIKTKIKQKHRINSDNSSSLSGVSGVVRLSAKPSPVALSLNRSREIKSLDSSDLINSFKNKVKKELDLSIITDEINIVASNLFSRIKNSSSLSKINNKIDKELQDKELDHKILRIQKFNKINEEIQEKISQNLELKENLATNNNDGKEQKKETKNLIFENNIKKTVNPKINSNSFNSVSLISKIDNDKNSSSCSSRSSSSSSSSSNSNSSSSSSLVSDLMYSYAGCESQLGLYSFGDYFNFESKFCDYNYEDIYDVNNDFKVNDEKYKKLLDKFSNSKDKLLSNTNKEEEKDENKFESIQINFMINDIIQKIEFNEIFYKLEINTKERLNLMQDRKKIFSMKDGITTQTFNPSSIIPLYLTNVLDDQHLIRNMNISNNHLFSTDESDSDFKGNIIIPAELFLNDVSIITSDTIPISFSSSNPLERINETSFSNDFNKKSIDLSYVKEQENCPWSLDMVEKLISDIDNVLIKDKMFFNHIIDIDINDYSKNIDNDSSQILIKNKEITFNNSDITPLDCNNSYIEQNHFDLTRQLPIKSPIQFSLSDINKDFSFQNINEKNDQIVVENDDTIENFKSPNLVLQSVSDIDLQYSDIDLQYNKNDSLFEESSSSDNYVNQINDDYNNMSNKENQIYSESFPINLSIEINNSQLGFNSVQNLDQLGKNDIPRIKENDFLNMNANDNNFNKRIYNSPPLSSPQSKYQSNESPNQLLSSPTTMTTVESITIPTSYYNDSPIKLENFTFTDNSKLNENIFNNSINTSISPSVSSSILFDSNEVSKHFNINSPIFEEEDMKSFNNENVLIYTQSVSTQTETNILNDLIKSDDKNSRNEEELTTIHNSNISNESNKISSSINSFYLRKDVHKIFLESKNDFKIINKTYASMNRHENRRTNI